MFAGRYVSVLITDAHKEDGKSKISATKQYDNYDLQTIYFDGIKVPSLLSMNCESRDMTISS